MNQKTPTWTRIPRAVVLKATGLRRRDVSWVAIGRELGWPWQSIRVAVGRFEGWLDADGRVA